MTNAKTRALSLAAESRFEREIEQAERARESRGSLSGRLVDHDPVTGDSIFETVQGGRVRARTLSSSGVPFGTQRILGAGTSSASLIYDELPQAAAVAVNEATPQPPYSPLLTPGDPNLAGEDDMGDPAPIAPRGAPSDFAIDTTEDTAYYSKPGSPREWIALGGSGFIIDTVPPDLSTPGGDGAGYVQIVLEDGTDRFTAITYYRQVIPSADPPIDRWLPVGHRSYGVGRPDIDPNTIPRGIQHFNETTGDIFSSNGSEWVRAPRIADYHSPFFSIPNDLILVDQGDYFCLFGVDANGAVKPVKAAEPDEPCSSPDEDNNREGESICGENLFFGPAVGTCNWECTTFPDYEFC